MVGIGGRTRWSPAELRDSSPALVEAARWEVFVSRAWPGPDVVAEIESAGTKRTETQVRLAQVNARKALRELKQLLLPPDEGD